MQQAQEEEERFKNKKEEAREEKKISPREKRDREFERKLAEGYFDDVM